MEGKIAAVISGKTLPGARLNFKGGGIRGHNRILPPYRDGDQAPLPKGQWG